MKDKIQKECQRCVVIADDERDLLVLLRKVISKKCDCEVLLAPTGVEALELVRTHHPEVVITDILMPDMDGLTLLEEITRFDPQISTIMMTGYGTIEIAVKSLKLGAYDFFEKPFDNAELIHAVSRAMERTELLKENMRLQQQLQENDPDTELLGSSKQIRQTLDILNRLARSDATVLIRGESGTGKEVAARTLHRLSNRRARKMVTVNCPALPEQILESELFGYCKGAFTGADNDKDGLFKEAEGSTILLDEIGDIPVSIQTKLLRVLQEKEIQPLGQTKTVNVDVRVLASTNQNLEEKIEQGEFREDLFYRLNVMTVTMPSLDEMRDDIPLLAIYFLKRYCREHQRDKMEFSPEALNYLMHHTWKGNIRELQNIINRSVLLSHNQVLTPDDFLENGNIAPPQKNSSSSPSFSLDMDYREAKEELITNFSISYLKNGLSQTGGNVSSAARNSGMERQAFQRLMRRYNITSQQFRKK
ncbi:MAG: sigma-54 dependent transcriptional regulator [Thermodesulfobacteriota bacterium]